ncbi:hypothetical protein GCM10007939_14500 [Amylibacter marinus]|uniref:Metal-binding protein n=1 Tax=Amylibacter marinus TaxID=1475483 RepID=A0ABQ5VV84_9RHOB|nr:DUF1636 domain-containing protein [Amylibacter marinus]GLQ35167.1 hypothetical protein GCM10007939_14500 [Amylibacter marinus]
MPNFPDHELMICTTCRGVQSACELRDKLVRHLPSAFAIQMVECMAGCGFPTTVGFQAAGKAGYLFGAIETDTEIAALAEFARQYHQSDDGWTKAGERPRPLFKKTLARLPALHKEHR